jgi:Tol biopolymer transport system component
MWYDLHEETGAFLSGELEWSPDGESIAFTLAVPTAEVEEHYDKPFPRSIGILHLSSGYTPELIEDIGTSADEYAPTWSPDGRYIAFTSETDDVRQLIIANLETRDIQESQLEIASRVNHWLADGRLAFTAEDGDSYSLFVTDASMTGDWTTVTQVPLPFDTGQFDWWIDPATIETSETS